MHFFTSSQCFWMALTLQNLKLGENLEFSWYSCNILRYCSNRCIVWFFIPANCPAQGNRKFPVQLYVKIQILFEPPFWICKWANHLSFLAMLSVTCGKWVVFSVFLHHQFVCVRIPLREEHKFKQNYQLKIYLLQLGWIFRRIYYPDSEPTSFCSFSIMLHAYLRSNTY